MRSASRRRCGIGSSFGIIYAGQKGRWRWSCGRSAVIFNVPGIDASCHSSVVHGSLVRVISSPFGQNRRHPRQGVRPGDALPTLQGLLFEDGLGEVLPQPTPAGKFFGRGQMFEASWTVLGGEAGAEQSGLAHGLDGLARISLHGGNVFVLSNKWGLGVHDTCACMC